MNLDMDPVEGVDVLLEYLYTHEKPNFNKKPGKVHLRAEYAFVLGDKYGLPELRDFGQQKLIQHINTCFNSWKPRTDAEKEQMYIQIEHIWSWQQEGSEEIRSTCLRHLCTDTSVLEDKEFMDLISHQRQFSTDLIKQLLAELSAYKKAW